MLKLRELRARLTPEEQAALDQRRQQHLNDENRQWFNTALASIRDAEEGVALIRPVPKA